MPRTTLVLPTSTTSRFTIGNRLLRDHELARADGRHLVAVGKQRAALIVDTHPLAARGAVADHGCDAIARFVNGVGAPLPKNGLSIKLLAQPPVEMLHELLGRRVDAAELLGHLADGHRVRPALVLDRLDIDAGADQQKRAAVLDSGLDED